MSRLKIVLPVIVIAQFLCTSLWFAGNGVINDLILNYNISQNDLGHLTSAVQFGFITGTLIFALLSFADRYSPSKVFFLCASLGAIFNLGMLWDNNSFLTILLFRFFTGFFLAGIYPVGMKIAADYFKSGLGRSLGYLVGALVIGTALPHLLTKLTEDISWIYVIVSTSSLATVGGVLMILFVPDGPHRKASQKINLTAFFQVFKEPKFRSAAFGYFGHMWELYAFWAFVPVMIQSFSNQNNLQIDVAFWSFLIIAVGGPACVLGGYISEHLGVKKTATISILLSGLCCFISPLIFLQDSQIGVIAFLLFWGMVVIADSPLFSTLVANHAPPQLKGTALTIVNCLGFAITILSIQLVSNMTNVLSSSFLFVLLGIGPLLGLLSLLSIKNKFK